MKPVMATGLARLSKPHVEVKINGEAPEGSPAEEKYDEYQLKDAADTLSKAEEIKADKELMTAVGPHLEKKAKAYKTLQQIRNKALRMPK